MSLQDAGITKQKHPILSKLEAGLVPQTSGIYKMLGEGGKVLYVGKAKNLVNRLKSYMQKNGLDSKTKRLLSLVKDLEIITTQTESQALTLEASLIKALFPPYNILLKDDKSLPYIAISKGHDYPAVFKYRGKKQAGHLYFGPFGTTASSRQVVFEALDLIQKLFKLRTCTDADFASRKRPCLKHQIKLCTAPCVQKVSKQDYAMQVQACSDFFNAKDDSFKKQLAAKMQAHADNLEFEEAIQIRRQIEMISKVQQRGDLNFADFEDTDVVCIMQNAGVYAVQVFFVRGRMSFGSKIFMPRTQQNSTLSDVLEAFLMQFYTESFIPKEILININLDNLADIANALEAKIINPKLGKKLELVNFTMPNLQNELNLALASKASILQNLQALQAFLNLPRLPQRIDVFDNSHTAGTDFIGAMIVCGQDGFVKKEYRKYNVKNTDTKGGDDYAMMREVMTRRYKNAEPETLPDLVVIDGGKGQLSAVAEAFEAIGCTLPFVCVSKGPDRNAGREKFHTINQTDIELEQGSGLLFYFQNIRDEAHRFAISTHRAKRAKSFVKSRLDDIEGIGAKRKKLLLEHFGSVDGIKKAHPQDLAKVSGVSRTLAQKILETIA